MTSPSFHAPQDRPIRKMCGSCLHNLAPIGEKVCDSCKQNLEDFLAEGDHEGSPDRDHAFDYSHGSKVG